MTFINGVKIPALRCSKCCLNLYQAAFLFGTEIKSTNFSNFSIWAALPLCAATMENETSSNVTMDNHAAIYKTVRHLCGILTGKVRFSFHTAEDHVKYLFGNSKKCGIITSRTKRESQIPESWENIAPLRV